MLHIFLHIWGLYCAESCLFIKTGEHRTLGSILKWMENYLRDVEVRQVIR